MEQVYAHIYFSVTNARLSLLAGYCGVPVAETDDGQ
jgi:hypothetical protein